MTHQEAAEQAGREVLEESRAEMERVGMTLDLGLEKLRALMDATKPISCTIVNKAGKTKGQKDADSLTTDFIEVPDNTTQIRALDMYFKLLSAYPAEKRDVKHTGNVTVEVINYADSGEGKVGEKGSDG